MSAAHVRPYSPRLADSGIVVPEVGLSRKKYTCYVRSRLRPTVPRFG